LEAFPYYSNRSAINSTLLPHGHGIVRLRFREQHALRMAALRAYDWEPDFHAKSRDGFLGKVTIMRSLSHKFATGKNRCVRPAILTSRSPLIASLF